MTTQSLLAPRDADDATLIAAGARLGLALQAHGLMIVTAESCTGGGIARALTETAGSSAWFDGGFVTYSNHAKHCQLGVPNEVIEAHGAVSEQTARAMATGALERSAATVSISVTGVAGPGGGSPDKPVGTVWFGFARKTAQDSASGLANEAAFRIDCVAECHVIDGDRSAVRLRTALHAIQRTAEIWL